MVLPWTDVVRRKSLVKWRSSNERRGGKVDAGVLSNDRATWPVLVALLVHGLVFGGLWFLPGSHGWATPPVDLLSSDESADGRTWFALQPLPEGSSLLYMASARMHASPPVGSDDLPDAEPLPGAEATLPGGAGEAPLSDDQLAEVLAADREALQAELDRMSELAMAEPLPGVKRPMPPPSKGGRKGGSDEGPQGAIRELTLDGYPQKVVDGIMDRYNLHVTMQTVKGGRRGQSFLSSAASGGDQYFGGMTVPAGVYEVFQLSRETVALMSRLEEKALCDRGFEPLRARVIRIVFGIVETKNGEYALGVKSLEAESVTP